MAFKDTQKTGPVWNPTASDVDEKREEATENDYLDGYYLGCKEIPMKDKTSTLHTVKTDDGEETGVWGTKMLNDELGKRRIGDYIRIQWMGKVPTKSGALIPEKKRKSTDTFHKWKVFIDDEKPPMQSNAQAARAEVSKPTGGFESKAKTNAPVDEDSDLPFFKLKYPCIF